MFLLPLGQQLVKIKTWGFRLISLMIWNVMLWTGIVANNATGEVAVDQYHHYKVGPVLSFPFFYSYGNVYLCYWCVLIMSAIRHPPKMGCHDNVVIINDNPLTRLEASWSFWLLIYMTVHWSIELFFVVLQMNKWDFDWSVELFSVVQ